MSKFYTDIRQLGDSVFHTYIEDGRREYEKFQFSPKVYVKSNKDDSFKSIYDENLAEIDFDTISDCRKFIEQHKSIANFPMFGNQQWAFQFLGKEYPEEIQYDSSKIDICFLDIETEVSDSGFPHAETALEKITLITLHSTIHGTITFGYKPYTGDKAINYVFCDGETALLRAFIGYWIGHYPDVIVGWNSESFDLPYIVNRIANILGNDFVKKLSPFGIVRARDVRTQTGNFTTFDIYGIQHLDYLLLYKKFTNITRENYKLDTIAYYELNQQKVKNPYKTFKEYYEKDWNRFTFYNVEDTMLVSRLEDKLKLIQIALKIAYIAKINFGDCYSPVKTWESIINNHLMETNVIPPLSIQNVDAGSFEGAYVKQPKQGLNRWVVSIDARALYPSEIIQNNISPETFVGMHEEYNKVAGFVSKEYDLSFLKEENLTIAANGAMFSKEKQGFLPVLCVKMLNDRQTYKTRMIELKKIVKSIVDPIDRSEIENEISMLSNFEQAIKLTLNSLYGGVSNSYFKLFDLRLASAITMSGQLALKYGEAHINPYLNKLFDTGERDYCIYEDTDSIYIDMDEFILRYKPEGTTREKVNFLDTIFEKRISKVINECYLGLYEYCNGYTHELNFKREVISSRSFWVAKKKYAMLVENSEGVTYDPYYLKVMGLEIVRSSTPECVRDSLKKCVELVLTTDNDTIIKFINGVKEDFMQRPPHEISFPRGINNIVKYDMENGMFKSGCPVQVRAAINHNRLVKKLKIKNIYPLIVDGDKIKFCYLREPNTLRQNVIGFVDEFPSEFGLNQYVDYHLQFEKTFLKPLESILHSVGWVSERTPNLFSFFGA